MGGAVIFNGITFRFIYKAGSALVSGDTIVQLRQHVDVKLIIGSIIFGVGWGLSGICPGPAIVNIATLDPTLLIFVLFMIISMAVTEIWLSLSDHSSRGDSRM